jgi:hypothetical protein
VRAVVSSRGVGVHRYRCVLSQRREWLVVWFGGRQIQGERRKIDSGEERSAAYRKGQQPPIVSAPPPTHTMSAPSTPLRLRRPPVDDSAHTSPVAVKHKLEGPGSNSTLGPRSTLHAALVGVLAGALLMGGALPLARQALLPARSDTQAAVSTSAPTYLLIGERRQRGREGRGVRRGQAHARGLATRARTQNLSHPLVPSPRHSFSRVSPVSPPSKTPLNPA